MLMRSARLSRKGRRGPIFRFSLQKMTVRIIYKR